MKDTIPKYSLLPYLNQNQKNIYLKLSFAAQDTEVMAKRYYPFLIIEDSDPLARLVEARFVTDAESEIRKVFLFLQRDEYLFVKDELWPVNNKDIENSWKKALSFYTKKNQNASTSLIIFSHQINEKGEFARMDSLFFCKTKQVFFHPPCPRCGLPLHQCENDELLANAGLQPYSHSLKRYLYCPKCSEAGGAEFYGYGFDNVSLPCLKDHQSLIKEFGKLSNENCTVTQFPCAECLMHKECFSTDNKVLSKIVPFSFYPFYMLVFDAMSLNALDFLSFVSGASFEEIEAHLKTKHEPGRINCLKAIKQNNFDMAPFLYEHNEKYFLEILYLKLSFLSEVLEHFRSESNTSIPTDCRLSIERIWVKLSEQRGSLPFVWNFTVNYIDMDRCLNEIQLFPKPPSSEGLFSFGLIWFNTLLVNKKQTISNVYASLRENMEIGFSQEEVALFDKTGKDDTCSVFLPENIFWDPEIINVKENWKPFWDRSLRLGWSLLKMSFRDGVEGYKNFCEELGTLRKDIKRNLFGGESEIPLYEKDEDIKETCMEKEDLKKAITVSSDDLKREKKISEEIENDLFIESKAIYEIISNVIKKWDMETEVEKEEVDPDATVTLILKDLIKKTSHEKRESPCEILAETVIAPLEKGSDSCSNSQKQEDMEETVILSLEGLEKKRSYEQAKESQKIISETVIISNPIAENKPLIISQKEQSNDSDPKGSGESDIIEETIIIKTKKPEGKK